MSMFKTQHKQGQHTGQVVTNLCLFGHGQRHQTQLDVRYLFADHQLTFLHRHQPTRFHKKHRPFYHSSTTITTPCIKKSQMFFFTTTLEIVNKLQSNLAHIVRMAYKLSTSPYIRIPTTL